MDKTLAARMKKIENSKSKKVLPDGLEAFFISGEIAGSWEKSASWKCQSCGVIFDRTISTQVRSWNSRGLCECKTCSKRAGGRAPIGIDTETAEHRIEACEKYFEELFDSRDIDRIKSGELNLNTRVSDFDKNKVWWVCKDHGKYLQNLRSHVILGQGCPTCARVNTSNYGSVMENEVLDYCKTLVDDTIYKDRNTLCGREIDIFIPSKSIGIEVNGSYYHATLGGDQNMKPKEKNYHFDKFRLAEAQGVHLIQIYDVDWLENQDKVKNYLKYTLTPSVKIYARKCTVSEVDKKSAMEFCDKYHIQGGMAQQSINYGLYLDGELLSVMSFSHKSYSSWSDEYELHRYCVKDGINILGGAEKLHKTFVSKYNPKKIYSYSDNQWFLGGIYPKLGYKFEGNVSPDYYWYKNHTRYSKRTTRLDDLAVRYPETYKESEGHGNREDYIMVKEGFTKVYLPGRKRWIYI